MATREALAFQPDFATGRMLLADDGDFAMVDL
jgi:hypothetical protein